MNYITKVFSGQVNNGNVYLQSNRNIVGFQSGWRHDLICLFREAYYGAEKGLEGSMSRNKEPNKQSVCTQIRGDQGCTSW